MNGHGYGRYKLEFETYSAHKKVTFHNYLKHHLNIDPVVSSFVISLR